MKRLLITLGIAAAGIVGLDLWLRRQPRPLEPEFVATVLECIRNDLRNDPALSEHRADYAEIAAARARRT